MQKLTIILIITIVSVSANYGQESIDYILFQVENNNTTLKALQKSAKAEKIGNKTGIYLQNPELEFDYLWGSPVEYGNRIDFSITQSFDFPTAYSYKNQISDIRNEQVDLEYYKQKKALFLQTRLLCFDLIYTNALIVELSKRLAYAQSISNSYKRKYDIGDANILEYNKAQLNRLNVSKELEKADIQRTSFLDELTILNGGVFIDFSDSISHAQIIPPDFEEWYAMAEQNNPILNWLKHEIEVHQKQEKLNRANSLPKLQIGYKSENVVGLKYQGVSVGVAIPLFENKNTVKYSVANSLAIESIRLDSKMQFYNSLKSLHSKAISLQENVRGYRTNLKLFDNTGFLEQSLEQGEINLVEYIMEYSIYYESFNNLLELERDLNKTVAEMNQYL